MDEAFAVGKEVIQERFGPYQDEPRDYDLEPGLLDEGRAAHTDITFSTDQHGEVTYYDKHAEPNRIVVDKDLYERSPEDATKSLLHELVEWHVVERMPSNEVTEQHSHTVAKYNDRTICREVNTRLGEDVCNPDWNSKYDS